MYYTLWKKIVSYLEDMTRISILKKSFLTHALMELVFKKNFVNWKKILEIGNRVLQQTAVKGLFIVHLKRLPLIWNLMFNTIDVLTFHHFEENSSKCFVIHALQTVQKHVHLTLKVSQINETLQHMKYVACL